MFEYEGPVDLTEYYVRNTEFRAETNGLIKVEVNIEINGTKNNSFL